jgi:predicted RNA-binding Zn-ribbon protein involved in translation (DUF1610 family)
MRTSVASQKIVTVAMSVEEWAEWLENPKTLLVQIENLALAAELEPQTNGHKPAKARKVPKGKTARAAGKARGLKKTGTTYDCPRCGKEFKKLGNCNRHIERTHVSDVEAAAG